jgi:hypothetical protein
MYISLLEAARRLHTTEPEVLRVVQEIGVRLFRGSLGNQMTGTDWDKLREAVESGKKPVKSKDGPGKAGAPKAAAGKAAEGDSGKSAAAVRAEGGSGKSPTARPPEPREQPRPSSQSKIRAAMFEMSDSEIADDADEKEGSGVAAGESFFNMLMDELKEGKAEAEPEASSDSVEIVEPTEEETREAEPAEEAREAEPTPRRAKAAEPSARAEIEEPPAVGRARQLLMDDAAVESAENVFRQWHQPVKHPGNPVLLPDSRWERGGYSVLCGTVLFDPADKVFKMWYHSLGRLGRTACYATSTDGLHWNKPQLEISRFEDKPTNIVMAHPAVRHYAEILGVAKHAGPKTDPARTYRSAFVYVDAKGGRKGVKTAVSADGLRWTADQKLTLPAIQGIGHLLHDEQTGNYVIYGRGNDEQGRRIVVRTESPDFVNWSEAEPVLTADEHDPEGTEIYSMSVLNYGRFYIGLVQVYHGPPECLIDIQLAVSLDGRHWDRPWREPFIPLGDAGEWDRYNTSVGCGPILRVARKELWLYYGGRTYRHTTYDGADKGTQWGAVGLAKLRIDGFASISAGFQEGTVVTKPILLKHPTVCVNVFNKFGDLRVEMLDADGRAVPGMISRPFIGDKHELPLTWPEGKSTAPFVGKKPVRLRFRLKNCRLYSFWTQ